MKLTAVQKKKLLAAMKAKFQPVARARYELGIEQVCQLWDKKVDGDFAQLQEFCLEHFVADEGELILLAHKMEEVLEQLYGHLTEVKSAFSKWKDLELGRYSAADEMLSQFNPFQHLSEDFFKIKLPFLLLLNFRQYAFGEVLKVASKWSRQEWANFKLVEGFVGRVPDAVNHEVFLATNRADGYINNLNFFVNCLRDQQGRQIYASEKRLISHWGLRDELKGRYGDEDVQAAQAAQELIFGVMERVVKGQVPQCVVNQKDFGIWQLGTNAADDKLYDQRGRAQKIVVDGNCRYQYWLDIFKAIKKSDPYYLQDKTFIDRRFNQNRKIPEAKVEKMLTSLLASPLLKKVGTIIEQRLGRPLRPYDIWYTGFQSGGQSQQTLDALVAKEYPTIDAFNLKIPTILQKLGFDKKMADFLGAHILAQPSRSAGHARGAGMRGAKALLRVRTDGGKLNYEAFNVCMHELGHTVEQTISMNLIDHTLLEGVPNTAFTEAIAFCFQGMDKKILGVPDSCSHDERALGEYWATCEIASMALVDLSAWRYLYKTKNPTAAGLREQVIQSANMLWKKYWAPVLGVSDAALLGIYSHMVDAALYLPDYPLGHIINYQIHKFFEHNPLASNLERMCKIGGIYPDFWMKEAVGSEVSAQVMLEDVAVAVKNLS